MTTLGRDDTTFSPPNAVADPAADAGHLCQQRLYLHLVGVHHVRANGLIIHHLFFGVAMVIPAAFLLAFGPRSRVIAILTRIGLGIGSAMVLDEIVYLVATQASDGDYVSALSLRGAAVFIALAVLLLLVLFRLHCKNDQPAAK